jgi:hypothetical protein
MRRKSSLVTVKCQRHDATYHKIVNLSIIYTLWYSVRTRRLQGSGPRDGSGVSAIWKRNSVLDCTYNTCYTYIMRRREDKVVPLKGNDKQNLTVRLDRKTIQRAKILAAKRSTSISSLVAGQIAILVGEDEAYERAERQAMALLDQGFHLGGVIRSNRDELHER